MLPGVDTSLGVHQRYVATFERSEPEKYNDTTFLIQPLILVSVAFSEKRILEERPRQFCQAICNREGKECGSEAAPAVEMGNIMYEKAEAKIFHGRVNQINAIGDAAPLAEPTKASNSRERTARIGQHEQE